MADRVAAPPKLVEDQALHSTKLDVVDIRLQEVERLECLAEALLLVQDGRIGSLHIDRRKAGQHCLAKEALRLKQRALFHRKLAQKGEAARFVPILTQMLDKDSGCFLEPAFRNVLFGLIQGRIS